MNRVILMGRLTRDPEVRYSQGENATAVARYTTVVSTETEMRAVQILLVVLHLASRQSLQSGICVRVSRCLLQGVFRQAVIPIRTA